MNTKLTMLLIGLIIFFSLVAGAVVYDQLPEPMASHWNINDEVDGYVSRFWGVFMLPLVMLVLSVIFFVIPLLDPLKENVAEFRGVYNLFILLMTLFLAYVWKLTIFWNLGYRFFKMRTALLPALGLLFIFVGYMLRTAKRNWFVGIRTPWTLSSDFVWAETHRLGGILFMVSGLLAILGVFFGAHALWFTILPILGSTVFLYIYSYILYRSETK